MAFIIEREMQNKLSSRVLDTQGSVCLFTTSGAPSGGILKRQKEPVEILNCVITPYENSKNKNRSMYMVEGVII